MKISLPSRRYVIGIITIIILIALVFGLQWFIKFMEQRKIERKNAQRIVLQSIINSRAQAGLEQLSQIDTDQDGLLDWKEALWQLDPNNPDTDGNGVLDGDQVAQVEEKLQPEGTSTVPLNATETLARDIYTTVTILQQSGKLDTDTTERLTDEIANTISAAVPVRVYSSSDITIVADSAPARDLYQNQLSQVLTQVRADDFVAILETALITNTADVDPTKSAAVVAKYDQILASLLKIQVPSRLAGSHVELVNTMSRLVANIGGIVNADQDPLSGLSSISQLQGTVDHLLAIISA